MLYLIESPMLKEVNGKKEYFSILKIGYTGDEDKTYNSRFAAYRLHNPGCKILYTIFGLTDKDEKRLHQKFKKYKYLSYGNEWFEYKSEIIEFFDRYSKLSIEEIRNELDNMFKEEDKISFIHSNRSSLRLVLARVLTSEECKRISGGDSILEDAYNSSACDFPSLLEYIKKKYGESVIKEYEQRMNILDSDNKSKMIVDEYYKSTSIVDKLKLLCNNKINDTILSNIPDSDELKTYYKLLGPEKIKSSYYNITSIRREFNKRTYGESNISYSIYSNFSVGDKLLLTDIKSMLKSIYDKIGYKGSPKATDLSNYFNLKELKLTIIDENGNKKRSKGFELLSVNPNYQSIYNEVKGIG